MVKITRKEYFENAQTQLQDIHTLEDLPTPGEVMNNLEDMGNLEWEYVPIIRFDGRRELAENVYRKLDKMIDERGDQIVYDMELEYEIAYQAWNNSHKYDDSPYEWDNAAGDYTTEDEYRTEGRKVLPKNKRNTCPWDD